MQYKTAQTFYRLPLPAFALCNHSQNLAYLALFLPSVAVSPFKQSNTHNRVNNCS